MSDRSFCAPRTSNHRAMTSVQQFDPRELDTRIGYLFKVVQTGLRDAMDRALEELELTTPLYAALMVIGQHPDISKADLARLCFVLPQSMTRMMATMEERGYVSRRAHPTHGRILKTRLTPSGRRKLAQASRAIDGVMDQVLDGFTVGERRQFMGMLARCRDQLAGIAASNGRSA
jgi:DNA-binding MarR family transcriptional regulator